MASYVEIDHRYISNPASEELYEKIGNNYALTSDTVVVSSKKYYLYDDYDEEDDEGDYIPVDVEVGDPVSGYYEFDGEDYVLTDDAVAIAEKEYFEYFDGNSYVEPFDYDDLYYVADEELENPAESGLYEKNENGLYVLSEDTERVFEKVYYLPVEAAEKTVVEVETSNPVYNPADIVPTGVRDVEVAYSEANAVNFLYAYTQFVKDPSAEGFYEILDGSYVLTQDTELVYGKAYYQLAIYSDFYEANMSGVSNPALSLTRYYEVSGGQYVLTDDTQVVSGKTYYRSRTDDKTPYLHDPSVGQTPATYDDIPFES